MLDFQRGRLAQAGAVLLRSRTLGDKLRGGSEEPFARAMTGLCSYAIDDETEGLEGVQKPHCEPWVGHHGGLDRMQSPLAARSSTRDDSAPSTWPSSRMQALMGS